MLMGMKSPEKRDTEQDGLLAAVFNLLHANSTTEDFLRALGDTPFGLIGWRMARGLNLITSHTPHTGLLRKLGSRGTTGYTIYRLRSIPGTWYEL